MLLCRDTLTVLMLHSSLYLLITTHNAFHVSIAQSSLKWVCELITLEVQFQVELLNVAMQYVIQADNYEITVIFIVKPC